MTKNNYGKQLQDIRLKRKISLDEIKKVLNIQIDYIEMIENNEIDNIPLPNTYKKLIVKNYIDYLDSDINPKHIIEENNAHIITDDYDKDDNIEVKDTNVDLKEKESNKNVLIFVFITIIIIAIAYYFFFHNKLSVKNENQITDKISKLYMKKTDIIEKTDNIDEKNTIINDNIRIKIEGIEKSWVWVVADSQQLLTVNGKIFDKNDTLVFDVKKSFIIKSGNAGGIKWFINDKEMKKFGKNGHVAYLRYTYDELKNLINK